MIVSISDPSLASHSAVQIETDVLQAAYILEQGLSAARQIQPEVQRDTAMGDSRRVRRARALDPDRR
jgi:hypothetical protein